MDENLEKEEKKWKGREKNEENEKDRNKKWENKTAEILFSPF